MRVLVVDDEPAFVGPLAQRLSLRGMDVRTAHDAREALFTLQAWPAELVFLDVGLPGMNGRQLAEIAMDRRPGLKVLFVTGYAEQAAVRNGLLREGMQMITKPFVIEELANRIRSILQAAPDTPPS